MAKVRVFEAAKQHGLEVQDLMNALMTQGVKVRSHLSPVEDEEVLRAVSILGGIRPGAGELEGDAEAAQRPIVRRRKKVEAPPPPEAELPVEPVTEELAPVPASAAPSEPAPVLVPIEEPPVPAEPLPPVEMTLPEPPTTEVTAAAEPEKAAPVAPPAEEAPAAPREEFRGLKVVRFIHPEDRPAPLAPVAPTVYPMSKQEREARKAEKKGKKGKKTRDREPVAEARRAPQKTLITVPKAIKRRIRISEVITVSELARRMGVKAPELIKKLISLGILATINQTLDSETASLVADEFGYEIENVVVGEEEMLSRKEDRPEDLAGRPPVVTVMGHVDHGKTSLLDAIRQARVAAGEAGGITQHIGAYEVETSRGPLVFLDTPGHEAFTAMRARGAQVTDIVVLVVAADDGVMPQTVEAVDHARAANVPIIVAINKMDKSDADPDRVRRELTDHGLVPEEWGGQTMFLPVSAKKKTGIEELLEMIALQAEVMELKANPDKPALGVVIEARLDRGRGPVATVLVQEGTLKAGDVVLAGSYYGRVRALTNDQGKRIKQAGPSIPVELTGMNGVPTAGENFVVVESERTAKEVAGRRVDKAREEEMAQARKITLADFQAKIAEGEVKELPLVIKADVQGSVEAVSRAMEKLSTGEVRVKVIHGAVGGITETDVNLASASNAIVVGFNVRPEAKAATLAEQVGVDIRLYTIIYDATDDVKKAMEGLLAPTMQEKVLGRAEVRQIFRVPKIGTVAGCRVTQGVVQRSARLRLLRDSVVVYEGQLASLKHFKDDVREVKEGLECGLSVQNYADLKEGDVLEFYMVEEVQRTL
ncbi:MAG: translation initiation factor IF-2 [Deltaproteobacteria bacterium]|nr:translation initiation factor IF-2 [Deltaproteobacteria bacterium]